MIRIATALSIAILWLPAAASAEPGLLADLPFEEEGPLGPVQSGHIAIDLSPDPKRPFVLLLDTGASGTVLSPRYARALRISVRRHKSTQSRRPTVLGRDVMFWIDTSSSDTAARTFEYGLLGADFLRNYVIEIDYAARRVRFLDPERNPVSEGSAAAGEIVREIRFTDGRPQLEIELGSGSAWFLMDTGAGLDLMLSEEKAHSLGIAGPEEGQEVRGRNVFGSDRSTLIQLPSVRVGEMEIRDVELAVAFGEGSSFRTTNLVGADEALLGNAFLSRFHLRLDYVNRRVGLLPRGDLPDPGAIEPTRTARSRRTESVPVPEDPLPPPDLAPARRADPISEEVWLELARPEAGTRDVGPLPWVEVRGWAGSGTSLRNDVMVLVDISGSTAHASGIDVNGNGTVGRIRKRPSWRSFNPRFLSSDAGDTILAAEIVATRRLIELLDPDRTRIGLISFSSRARLEASLGSDRETMGRALEELERRFGSGETNIAEAIELATDALLSAGGLPERTHRKTILILSDGYPTAPGGPREASKRAYRAATEASSERLRIHTFGLGLEEIKLMGVYAMIARVAHGRYQRVTQPGDIIHLLPLVRLTELADVEIRNLTTGDVARVKRFFPDGTFDGYLRVAPGENQIRVTARGKRGGSLSEERRLHFEPFEPATPEDAFRLEASWEAFRKTLAERGIETELLRERRLALERGSEPNRSLELELDPD